jgi:hypothetical protein
VRRVWLLVVAIGLCATHAIAPGCSSSSSTVAGGSNSGGSSSGGSTVAGTGGTGGTCNPDESDCSPDLCQGVKCPAAQYCAPNGICSPLPACDAGACSTCSDRSSCGRCNATAYAAGWGAYEAVSSCVSCKACYMSCGGATVPGWDGGAYCSGPPATVDSCDTGSCDDCTTCATSLQATCGAAWNACMASTDCNTLLGTVPECPAAPLADAGTD